MTEILYPMDNQSRKTESKACKILYYQLDTDHWAFKQELGTDVGRDCILELSEQNLWKNHKLEGQIKGRKKPDEILGGTYLSFPMEVKTINYALQSPIAFVLFVVDTTDEIVYCQPIQEYFMKNLGLNEKLTSGQKTVNIRIPKENTLQQMDTRLQSLAHKIYQRQENGLLIAV